MKRRMGLVLVLALLLGSGAPGVAQTPDDSLEQVNTTVEPAPVPDQVATGADSGFFFDPDEQQRLFGITRDVLTQLTAGKAGGKDGDLWTQLIRAINEILGGSLVPGIPGGIPGIGTGTGTGTASGGATGALTGALTGTPTGTSITTGTAASTGTSATTGTGATTGTTSGTGTGANAGGLSPASSDAEFEAAAAAFTGPRWTPMGGKPGDSEGKWQMPTFGFPDWFGRIQQSLIEHKPWTAEDREANKLIEAFARKKAMELNGGVLHSSFFEFFHYLGASAYNGQAGPLGGDGKNKIWCAGASRGTFQRGIKPYYMQGGYLDWLNKGKGKKLWDSSRAKAQENLQPGDIITIGHKDTGKDQHVATVVGVKGNKVLYVSGNAGGSLDGYGTVRIEEIDLSRINQVERLSQVSKEKLEAMTPEQLASYGIGKK